MSDLLAAIKAGEMTDTIRALWSGCCSAVEAEASAFIGVARHERNEAQGQLGLR